MPRNAEVVRQWNILREIEASRLGKTLDELADLSHVCTRTIRRDLDALQEAGFPLARDEDSKRWRLIAHPFHALNETGLSLIEACALYFSRDLLARVAGAPFQEDLESVLAKIRDALSPAVRAFIDQMPRVVVTKAQPRAGGDGRTQRDLVARLLEAILNHRQVVMQYHSFSHDRVKEYAVQPYQLAHGMGALYLIAFVPEYSELRTFTVGRIQRLSVLEKTFRPSVTVTGEVFPDSLGVHGGKPVSVTLDFAPRIARYVHERQWHRSQQTEELPDGTLRLRLRVCDDYALRSWILSFGSLVRVVAPQALAEAILAEHEDARATYAPRIDFDPPGVVERSLQPVLPFGRRAS